MVDDLYARPGDNLPPTMSVPFLDLVDKLRERNVPARISAGGADIDVEIGPAAVSRGSGA